MASKQYKPRVKPHGKDTRRQFAGQRIGGSQYKKGGYGKYNAGNPLDDYSAPFMEDEEDIDEQLYGVDGMEAAPSSLMGQVRTASLVQEKALASQLRRQGSGVRDDEPKASSATPWGQSNRLEHMKARLLALEQQRLSQMEPDRVELLNILADHQVTLDAGTIEAIIEWKRHTA